MTAQTPERIIIDGRPRALYSDPLRRLMASRRMKSFNLESRVFSTDCYRGYQGTWEIINGRLHLVHLNGGVDDEPLSPEVHSRFLKLVPCKDYPIPASWFSGHLRIAIGRRLVYRHFGWSHWFERERVIAIRRGLVTRDREVDTGAMLERRLAREPQLRAFLDGTEVRNIPPPLVWFDDSDDEDWTIDWWPPDYVRKDHVGQSPR